MWESPRGDAMRVAAAGALAAALLLPACGDDVERSTRAVCGETVEVAVDGDVVEVDGDLAGEWRLAWWPGGGTDLTAAVGALPLRTTATGDGRAWVTTPDGSCTALVGTEPPPVRVVGDSLAFQVAEHGLAPWEGTPGASWVTVRDDPASPALDEIRGAVADRPDALVLLFGANDALWSVADDTGGRRAAVADAIAVAVAVAETAGVPCVRVVTPSAGPTVIFDLGDRFTAEAEAIAELLRAAVPAEAVIDWTAVSAEHHLPDGTEGDWFPDGDEIHPNAEGRDALVALVEGSVAAC